MEAAKRKAAYVTFLAGDGDYVKGVVGLAKGLRKVGTAYPLVVAVLPDVPDSHRRLLLAQGCIVREIEPVHPPDSSTQFAMAYYVINYSKLRIWEFTEYEKILYLDSDIQVYENIDHLFELPDGAFYAVMDCFCEKTWSHTPQYRIGYCQQSPDRVPWPRDELGPPPPPYFNAGMFVSQPSAATAKALLAVLKVTPPTPFAEQDFLNMYFKDIYKPIPLLYNLVMAMLWRHPDKVELSKVKVVHYCAAVCTYSILVLCIFISSIVLICLMKQYSGQSLIIYLYCFICFGHTYMIYLTMDVCRDQNRGGTRARKRTWIEKM
ncbi:hypothetical protein LUZ61_005235 [Rhynchospora tenuis]|uniref:Hexosyltransferase n=1 Tax=Rhynchospora tenuis TaxID=198213 RepID=A0AAD6EUJ9_9POAL|nr:hypothetical protein LUZ61_005235 [Rhynchospora tenuis]